jgi:hypothetical protein
MISSLPRLGLATIAVALSGLVSTTALAQAPAAPAAGAAPAAPVQTPRLAGKPDFSGIWGGGVVPLTPTTCQTKIDAFNIGNDRLKAGGAKGGSQWITFEQDCGIQNRGRTSKPLYKPEYWQRIRLNDYYANVGGDKIQYADPEWQNLPRGVPRLGAPNKIVQTDKEVLFLYENQNQFRAIPTDCRPHDPVLQYDQTFNGLAVGCWDGDKLVVTSVGFTDKSWLHWSGYSHSAEMKVIETFERQGNALIYNVTVEDPVMFLAPWKMDTVRLNLNANPQVQLMQDVPYNDRSLGALTDPQYRG